MISNMGYNVKKSKFGRKIRSEVNFLLLQYIYRSVTKKFPIKTLFETIDSSVKSLEQVEYGTQNCLQHQKIPVRPKSRSEVYLPLALYINRSVTKKFPIKILLKTIDSSVKSLGKVEYDNQNYLERQKTQA